MKKNTCLNDIGAERVVLAGILSNGADALIDIEELLSPSDFYGPHHAKLFTVLKTLVHDKDIKEFDTPTIVSMSRSMGFDNIIGTNKDEEYIGSLFAESVGIESARSLASVVFKLSVCRQAYLCLRHIQKDMEKITGNEDILSIFSMIEDPIFGFTAKLASKDNALVHIGRDIKDMFDALSDNPKDIIGLPSGFQLFDQAIGGGLRPGGVTVVGARPKIGKSFFCLNVANNVAKYGVPVLYLDTELPRKWQMMRLASLLSKVSLNRIETGQFSELQEERIAVYDTKEAIDNLPLTHCSVAGQSIRGILSIVRRWLAKNVGFTPSGKAKPCVVIYDYLKLMDQSDVKNNLAEYQLLGFLLTEMHNFALKYDLPILATVQLNRDGGDREEGNVISGSDRILWLASSFTILKKKSQEELNEDPPSNGDRKLVITDTRFGKGMHPGDYINVKSDFSIAQMLEGQAYSQTLKEQMPMSLMQDVD